MEGAARGCAGPEGQFPVMSNRNAALCDAERDDGAPCTLELGHVPPHSYAGTHLHGSRWSHKHCDQRFTLQGVIYACEREQGHGGDHVYAFTAGQLQAVLTAGKPRFPVEALPLLFGAPAYTLLSKPSDVAGWVSLVIMSALGWRWVNIWQAERKGSSRS